jgi:hypothetical protein
MNNTIPAHFCFDVSDLATIEGSVASSQPEINWKASHAGPPFGQVPLG